MAGNTIGDKGQVMKCDQAAEFVSVLCDGEMIPREVAEHIGSCEVCNSRLSAYATIGNELRRVASLEQTEALKEGSWKAKRRLGLNSWVKGCHTMRIPKVAFASMLVMIAGLGSGLAILTARPLPSERVLMLTIRLRSDRSVSSNESVRCPVLTKLSEHTPCTTMLPTKSGMVGISSRILANDGNRLQLAVRTKLGSAPVTDPGGESYSMNMSIEDLNSWPEERYWFEPGHTLEIGIGQMGTLLISGELLDHMPALPYQPDESLNPIKNQFRVVSPMLIRDGAVVFDEDGSESTYSGPDAALMLYLPGEGRYLVSTVPFDGATEGTVERVRIKFNLEGRRYLFVTGMPACRSSRVWVLHDPKYNLSDHIQGAADNRPMFMAASLRQLLQQ